MWSMSPRPSALNAGRLFASPRSKVYWRVKSECVPMQHLPTEETREASLGLLGLVPGRWCEIGVQGSLLSRVCERELARALERIAFNGGGFDGIRLRLVRSGRDERFGPGVSHVVPSWEGADGVRAAARWCMCRTIANPDYEPR